MVSVLAAAGLVASAATVRADETINFEGLNAGAIVNSVTVGGVNVPVFGENPDFPGQNAAMIFDSSCPGGCSGDDPDLGSPNADFGGPGIGAGGEQGAPYENTTALGKILIISEDLDSNDPDDADNRGESIIFNFSNLGSVTLKSMKVVDVEAVEPVAKIEMLDGSDAVIATVNSPAVGDNGVATVDLGPTSGVVKLVVTLNGSGAIDDIVIERDETGGEGCTPGYWKVRQHLDSWAGAAPGDNFDTTFGVQTTFNPDNCERPDGVPTSDPTLLKAMWCKGGGLNALARHAVAALLNSLSSGVDYAYSTAQVKQMVQDAIGSGNYTATKNLLAAENEEGCSLN